MLPNWPVGGHRFAEVTPVKGYAEMKRSSSTIKLDQNASSAVSRCGGQLYDGQAPYSHEKSENERHDRIIENEVRRRC
ncbi:hypothetical protein CEXT_812441 [Caerostris extrusa]|uniref:Uncharacterized protein n=1 Tax=Caerostris extrusa TaxID=172846 RepID=A0AAV4W1J5_CAEEX|nr:hypothetical protein CEXT_812441 [Caerostris extrusa]